MTSSDSEQECQHIDQKPVYSLVPVTNAFKHCKSTQTHILKKTVSVQSVQSVLHSKSKSIQTTKDCLKTISVQTEKEGNVQQKITHGSRLISQLSMNKILINLWKNCMTMNKPKNSSNVYLV